MTVVSQKDDCTHVSTFRSLDPINKYYGRNRIHPTASRVLQFHTARLGKGGDTPFSPSLDADVSYQSKLLSTSKVEVISLIQTSASLFEEGYDARIKAMISDAAGVPAVTSAEAAGQALNALGTKRIALVSPYSEEVIDRAKGYYERNAGLEVVAMEGFGATNAYAIGALDESHALEAFSRVDGPAIEALSYQEAISRRCATSPAGRPVSASRL